MKTTKKLTILAVAALLLGSTGGAFAATVGDTLDVTAAVQASCSLTTTDVAFGNVDVLSGSNIDSTTNGNVAVTCSTDTNYTIGLNAGTGGGTDSARTMVGGTGGTDHLAYSLSNASNGGANWGNTEGSWVEDIGDGTAQTHTVFGRIPSGQTGVSEGSYTSTVTATVTF